MIKKCWLVIIFLLLTSPVLAQFEQCRNLFPNGKLPSTVEVGRDLCFDSFAVLYSPDSKKPIYVVERLNRQILESAHEKRTNHFYEEARLRSNERSKLIDYSGSGFDRGHNAPAGDMSNPNAMAQSFSLANMMPQAAANNRGIWAKSVEKPTRQYILKRASGDVFVFTGSVGEAGRIGPDQVVVPTHLFKLVYDQVKGKAWAYWIENSNEARMIPPISYEEIQRLTHIDFKLQVN